MYFVYTQHSCVNIPVNSRVLSVAFQGNLTFAKSLTALGTRVKKGDPWSLFFCAISVEWKQNEAKQNRKIQKIEEFRQLPQGIKDVIMQSNSPAVMALSAVQSKSKYGGEAVKRYLLQFRLLTTHPRYWSPAFS